MPRVFFPIDWNNPDRYSAKLRFILGRMFYGMASQEEINWVNKIIDVYFPYLRE